MAARHQDTAEVATASGASSSSSRASFASNLAKCLGTILCFPLLLVCMIAGMIFLLGPFLYYRLGILNDSSLMERYALEGVRHNGRVVKRWIATTSSDTTYHIVVAYRVAGVTFAKHLTVGRSNYRMRGDSVELAVLPAYPKSVLLYDVVHHRDEITRDQRIHGLLFGFFWTTLWNLIPTVIILTSIGCSYCRYLIAPVFVVMLVAEFIVGYYVARTERDASLRRTLYGAREYPREMHRRDRDPMPRVTYAEFMGEGKKKSHHSCCCCYVVVATVVKDLAKIFAWIISIPVMVVLGSGCLVWHNTVFARKRLRLLEEFDEGVDATGSVVRRTQTRLRVAYELYGTDKKYVKDLRVPKKVIRYRCGICCYGARVEYDDVDLEPDLKVLRSYPASAQLACRIDDRHREYDECKRKARGSAFLVLLQLSVFGLYAVTFINSSSTIELPLSTVILVVTGSYLVTLVVVGYAMGLLYHRVVFVRNLLYGEKVLTFPLRDDGGQGNVLFSSSAVDLERPAMEIETANPLVVEDDFGNETALTASTTEDSISFVSRFMSGRFPRMEKAFT